MTCRLQLTNGWTVSISDGDTPPAICTVAAWPTRNSGDPPRDQDAWFDWGGGMRDRRCWTLSDISQALAVVGDLRNTLQ